MATQGKNALELGRELATFRWVVFPSWVTVCLPTLIGIGIMAVLIGKILQAHQRPEMLVSLVTSIVVLILFATSVLLFQLRQRVAQKRAVLHENGIRLLNARGAASIRWDQIKSLHRQEICTRGSTRAFYRLELHDGRKVTLSSPLTSGIIGSEVLATAIEDHLVPAILERFVAGEEIDFAVLQADTIGIRAGSKELRWNQVQRLYRTVFLYNGSGHAALTIASSTSKWLTWKTWPLQKVANVTALLAIAEMMITVNAPGGAAEAGNASRTVTPTSSVRG